MRSVNSQGMDAWPGETHTKLFQRLYNVHNVGMTSYGRYNDVESALGLDDIP